MPTGAVKWFDAQEGYGFIQHDDGPPDVFVHVAAVERAGMDGARGPEGLLRGAARPEPGREPGREPAADLGTCHGLDPRTARAASGRGAPADAAATTPAATGPASAAAVRPQVRVAERAFLARRRLRARLTGRSSGKRPRPSLDRVLESPRGGSPAFCPEHPAGCFPGGPTTSVTATAGRITRPYGKGRVRPRRAARAVRSAFGVVATRRA